MPHVNPLSNPGDGTMCLLCPMFIPVCCRNGDTSRDRNPLGTAGCAAMAQQGCREVGGQGEPCRAILTDGLSLQEVDVVQRFALLGPQVLQPIPDDVLPFLRHRRGVSFGDTVPLPEPQM